MPNQSDSRAYFQRAVLDFQEARRKAALQSLLEPLHGRPLDLLSYDEVRKRLHAVESSRRELKDIPLDQIVGSVGRIGDFTRDFLPLRESDRDRWARVRAAVENLSGLPPIEVYQVGEAYFVLDGHHRVSVARELGAERIEGYVIPVATRVPLSPGDSPDDLIIKSEYADFLARTRFDELRPGASLLVSAPGQYPKIYEHISVHRHFMGNQQQREIPEAEATTDWYDRVYLPVAALIRERNLLRDFPERTETDLYLWLMDYRVALSGGEPGWEVDPGKAAQDLSSRFSPRLEQRLARVLRRLAHLVVPAPLQSAQPSGSWMEENQPPHRADRLFDDILVTVTGGQAGWAALDLAFEIAAREEARLSGLHVVTTEAEKDSPAVQALREEFLRRCAERGIFGRLLVETGSAADQICRRAPWVDLSIFRLSYPPSPRIFKRLRSGTRTLIRRCGSPLLAAPDAPFRLNSALLAYGPGRKSDEALYAAAYLAARWAIPLTVVSAQKEGQALPSPAPLERAQAYLEARGVTARYVLEQDCDPAQAVLLNAEAHEAGLIITGGYEASPLREIVAGSSVDRILRSTRRPVLICR